MNLLPRAMFLSGAIITLMGLAVIWRDVMTDTEIGVPHVAVAMTLVPPPK